MKVYIATDCWEADDRVILGVFTTREAAEACAAREAVHYSFSDTKREDPIECGFVEEHEVQEPLSDAERVQILGTIRIWCADCGAAYMLTAERWSGVEHCECGSDAYALVPRTFTPTTPTKEDSDA